MRMICSCSLNNHLTDRSNGRQSFSTKTEGANTKQIRLTFYLTGGVTADGKRYFIRGNSLTVIRDLNHFKASLFNTNFNLTSPCVNGIFHQLLNHTGWSLNDVASRNLVG